MGYHWLFYWMRMGANWYFGFNDSTDHGEPTSNFLRGVVWNICLLAFFGVHLINVSCVISLTALQPAVRGNHAPYRQLDFLYAITYISLMKTLSSTELRATLSAVMDRVNDDHEPVIVTRAGGKPVVMVSLEDWASMDETTYLLASPANRAALEQAMDQAKQGLGITLTEQEFDELAAK